MSRREFAFTPLSLRSSRKTSLKAVDSGTGSPDAKSKLEIKLSLRQGKQNFWRTVSTALSNMKRGPRRRPQKEHVETEKEFQWPVTVLKENMRFASLNSHNRQIHRTRK